MNSLFETVKNLALFGVVIYVMTAYRVEKPEDYIPSITSTETVKR